MAAMERIQCTRSVVLAYHRQREASFVARVCRSPRGPLGRMEDDRAPIAARPSRRARSRARRSLTTQGSSKSGVQLSSVPVKCCRQSSGARIACAKAAVGISLVLRLDELRRCGRIARLLIVVTYLTSRKSVVQSARLSGTSARLVDQPLDLAVECAATSDTWALPNGFSNDDADRTRRDCVIAWSSTS